MEKTSTPVLICSEVKDKNVDVKKLLNKEKILNNFNGLSPICSKIVESTECVFPYFENNSPNEMKTRGEMINADLREDGVQDDLRNDSSIIIPDTVGFMDGCFSSTRVDSIYSEFNKSFHCDGSIENDYTFDDMDTKKVKETILEMRLAVHNYMNKIKKLDISVKWELPEILKSEKSVFKTANGIKGPLSPEEVHFIKKRLKQFCKEYKINYRSLQICMSQQTTTFQFPNEIRLKFIQYLCKDFINDRHPLSLYRAISKLGLRKGRFSEDEINFLIEMYHSYSGVQLHSVCGLLLNRHRSHIFKKIVRLKKRNMLGSRPSVKTQEPSKLRKLILENILSRNNYSISSLPINARTWISIGRECNTSAASAKAIYMCEIMPQIFAEHPVKFHHFFSKLIKRIKVSRWETWEDVKWKRLSKVLYGTGKVFVYVMLRKLVMSYVPKEKWRNFQSCAEYLYLNVLPYFKDWEGNHVTLNKIIINPNFHE